MLKSKEESENMKNKFLSVLLILLSICLITACGKKDDDKVEVIKKEEVKQDDEVKLKELHCITELSSSNAVPTKFGVSFVQDQSTYDLVSGEATIVIDYTDDNTYSEEALKQALPKMKETFCSRDYFGENTTKSCDMTLDGKKISVTLEIDTDAFLTSAGIDKKTQLNADTLKNLRTSLEDSEATEYKCSIK